MSTNNSLCTLRQGRGPRQDLHPKLTQLKEVVPKKQVKKRMKGLSLLPKVLAQKMFESWCLFAGRRSDNSFGIYLLKEFKRAGLDFKVR